MADTPQKVSPGKVIGYTGLRRAGGYVSADFLPQLNGLYGKRQLGEMALNNSIKASEKCDLFRRLGQQFLLLSGQIENDIELTENDFNIIAIRYENLINECLFEEIPSRYKIQVADSYKDRHVPLQLNGSMGVGNTKRPACTVDVVVSSDNVATPSNIV